MVHARLPGASRSNSWRSIVFSIQLAAVSIVLFAMSASAQQEAPDVSLPTDRAEVLIEQLDSEDYQEREEATELLVQMGPPVIHALQQALNHPSPEVRYRASRILSIINRPPSQEKFDAFVAGMLDEDDSALPGWRSFREMMGDERETRRLYVQMLKEEWDLLRTFHYSPENTTDAFSDRWQELGLEDPFGSTESEITLGTVCTLLFVSTDPQVNMAEGKKCTVFFLCCGRQSFCSAMEGGSHQEDLRKILGRWVEQGSGRVIKLNLAMRYQLDEGLASAERILSQEEFVPTYEDEAVQVMQSALLAVAMFGNEEQHTDLLESHYSNATVCPQHNRPPNYGFDTQICDIALACRIHLAGESPREFGFHRIRLHSQKLFRTETLGFRDDESRTVAFDLWQQHIEE